MTAVTIGMAAKRAGVGVETVRFYERQGLVKQPERKGSGYRHYPEEVVDRIRFIRHAKDLGFTLKEISQLLSLRTHPSSNCVRIKQRAETKIADIDGKIRGLRRMRTSLVKLTRACERREATAECPILEALE